MPASMPVEIAIIGGSFAGLSAALFLGNALRKVALINDGLPRNQAVSRAHNILGYENTKPGDLLAKGRQKVAALDTVNTITTTATSVEIKQNEEFTLRLQNGKTVNCKKLILATGVTDQLPDIKGIKPFWPHNIFHCPYCIACELQDQPLAIYNTTDEAYFLALIVRKWTQDLMVFTDGNDVLSAARQQHLQQLGIAVCSDKVSHFSGTPGKVINIHLDQQKTISRRGIFMHLPIKQRAADIIATLGCEYTADNLLKVDENYQTSVPDVYAIGDTSQLIQKVTTAIASGNVAAFAIDHQLTEAMFVENQ